MLFVMICCINYSRDSSFDKKSTGSLKINTKSSQTAISGNFPIQLAMCNITYVTTDSFNLRLLIHVHNGDHDTRTIKTVSSHEHVIIPKMRVTLYFIGAYQWN